MNNLEQKFDASTVAIMRQALNEVVADQRFLVRKSVTPLEVAERTRPQPSEKLRIRKAECRCLTRAPAQDASQHAINPPCFNIWRSCVMR
jgi:hypothetical protein